jgi:hypothetical protein
MTTVLEDETAQKKGVCDMMYTPGDLLAIPSLMKERSQLYSKTGGMMEGLPCRVTAFQFCYNDKRVKYLLSGVAMLLGNMSDYGLGLTSVSLQSCPTALFNLFC